MCLERFEKKYSGERAFLLGNGPSLSNTPLEKLDDEFTFAMNKIDLLYDETDWRPSFFMMAKKTGITDEQIDHYMNTISLGIPSFVTRANYEEFPDRDNIYAYDRVRLIREGGKSEADMEKYTDSRYSAEHYHEIWTDDITDVVPTYASTMYDAVQFASYMGFDDLYLLGCDLGYEDNIPYLLFEDAADPHEYESIRVVVNNSENVMKSLGNMTIYKILKTNIGRELHLHLAKQTELFADPNHFDESYQPHQKYRHDINEQLVRSHEIMANISNEIGVSIYNATLGGDLEVYPRVDLDDVL